MAYEIIINKRFTKKLQGVLDYLEHEWGVRVATEFLDKVQSRIFRLQTFPFTGTLTSVRNVRSTIITRHNRMYYRIVKNKVVILNMYDTRRKKRKE